MIWIAVLLYSLIAIYIGWRSQQKSEDGTEFWTAGQNLGGGSVGLSISAGFMSVSWSCVYAVQLFYWYGLAGIWLITVPWLLALTGIYFLAKKYRALPAFSQPEMVGDRFGKRAKQVVAIALAFVFLVWGGAEIYVAANLLSPQLGLSVSSTIIGICVVVGIYATMGGFRAVVATDKLQYFIVAVYILVMTWLAIYGLWESEGRILPDSQTLALKSLRPWTDLVGPGLLTIVIGMIAYLPGWIFETDLWVRVQAAKNEREARLGMIIAGGNALLFVGILPLLIGIIALALFPAINGIAPEIIGNQGDSIFFALVQHYAPPWLVLLTAVGLVAAAMSTIDTCANVMALSIAYDLLSLHKKANGKKQSQYITALVMIAAGIFALNTESLWDIFYLSGGILTTAIAFPVAAVFLSTVNIRGVTWSAFFGLFGTITAYFMQASGLLSRIQPQWLNETDLAYILWGIVIAVLGYFIGAGLRFPEKK